MELETHRSAAHTILKAYIAKETSSRPLDALSHQATTGVPNLHAQEESCKNAHPQEGHVSKSTSDEAIKIWKR